jgi:hypothetical protein
MNFNVRSFQVQLISAGIRNLRVPTANSKTLFVTNGTRTSEYTNMVPIHENQCHENPILKTQQTILNITNAPTYPNCPQTTPDLSAG